MAILFVPFQPLTFISFYCLEVLLLPIPFCILMLHVFPINSIQVHLTRFFKYNPIISTFQLVSLVHLYLFEFISTILFHDFLFIN